jgi:hypothetical protein
MTVSERIEDIKARTGLSEQIIRTVLNAETDSVIASLERGERAVLMGRCAFTPRITSRTDVSGETVNHIGVSAKASSRISGYLFSKREFAENKFTSIEDTMLNYDDNIRLFQIEELA